MDTFFIAVGHLQATTQYKWCVFDLEAQLKKRKTGTKLEAKWDFHSVISPMAAKLSAFRLDDFAI